jgi:hypothetical protein
MPIKEIRGNDDPRLKEGHIAILTGADGTAMPVVPGMFVLSIPEPDRPDRVVPMILLKVSLKKWEFACACGNKQCNRRLTYKLEIAGHHPFMQVGPQSR